MRDILFIAFMTLFFLEVICVIKLIVMNKCSKKYANSNNPDDKKKHEFFEKMLKVTDFEFAAVMILKVIIENNIRVPFWLWFIDVIIMGLAVTELLIKHVIRKDANQAQRR